MYWSEWGTSKCIKKSAMDGSLQRKIITTNGPANGLTIDYHLRRLYWIENDLPSIMSSDLHGNDRKIVVKGHTFKPLGLTLYKDFIYWSDNSTGSVYVLRKLTQLFNSYYYF